MSKKHKYGVSVPPKEVPKQRRRLPQYDECLREFLSSGDQFWRVDIKSLPSDKPKVILSSLKWRIKHKLEFKGIRVFVRKTHIYLERVNHEKK